MFIRFNWKWQYDNCCRARLHALKITWSTLTAVSGNDKTMDPPRVGSSFTHDLVLVLLAWGFRTKWSKFSHVHQITIAGAHILDGRQEAEHPRVQDQEEAWGRETQAGAKDAAGQPWVQTSARLQAADNKGARQSDDTPGGAPRYQLCRTPHRAAREHS